MAAFAGCCCAGRRVRLLWLRPHVYLVPLLVHLAHAGLFNVRRRAAFIALGRAWYAFGLLPSLPRVSRVSLVFLPGYALVGPACISPAQARGLRQRRFRHGRLVDSPDEEVSRL